ncbi:MAG: replicative DNA helicase [Candidatus Paceibacterota bacterium]|jgi:replicative DNA helicase
MHENNKKSLRVPPHNLESEQALLGSVMLLPDALNEVLDVVNAESYYTERHRLIYETMIELWGKGQAIDSLTLSARLNDKGALEQVGGMSYLSELTNAVPSSVNVEHYAKIVQKKYMIRRLIHASEQIGALGYNEENELEEIMDEAEKHVYDISNNSSVHKYITMGDALDEAWERLDKLHKSGNELRGVPTGFPGLDDKLAGLQKSDLIILAARPSMGKTSLALDIARQAAITHKIPVAIFSLEMSSQQLVDRMLAAESRVDAWKLRTGKLSMEQDFGKIRDSLASLSKAPIYIDDQAGNNILKMRAIARRLKSEKGLGLIVVDYLQLMVPTNSHKTDNLVQQVTEISRSLKNLARELDVPVLALSQLSRAVEARGGKPRLSDLRDSGSIEQDADVVLFIHREREEDTSKGSKSNVAEIMIEKHRNGPTGTVQLYFDDRKSTFLSVEKSDFGDFDTAGGEGASII